MEPTIRAGQMVLLNHNAYKRMDPKRWDVVFFEPVVDDPGALWVMRIVGLPGETISITENGIMVNGQLCPLPNGATWKYAPVSLQPGTAIPAKFPFVIPTNACFVLGDNATNSYDSRFWGSLPRNKIKGKVMLVE